MKNIYESLVGEEKLMKDILIPKYFPAIYIDENGEIYCYHGVYDKNRFLFASSPCYLEGKKSIDVKKHINGFFRIKNGQIFKDNFIDENLFLNEDKKAKLLPYHLHFLQPQDMSFGVYKDRTFEENEEISRQIFGLTYKELNSLLQSYKNISNIHSHNYPSVTRANTKNNFCDITDTWIPKDFPYIAFDSSEYYYSHISLYGFYCHINFLTFRNINSEYSKKLIENGLSIEILENIHKFSDYGLNETFNRYNVLKAEGHLD